MIANISITSLFLIGLIVGLITNISLFFMIALFFLIAANIFLGIVNQRKSLATNIILALIVALSMSILTEYISFIIGFLISAAHLGFFIRYFIKENSSVKE